MAFSGTVILT